MTIETQYVIGAFLALASAIAYLWRAQVAGHQVTSEKLAHCEQGHQKSNEKILELTASVSEMKGRQSGIEELADNVLRTVADVSARAQASPKG